MAIDQNEVRKIARLARLEISDEECEIFSKSLSDILTYVAKLDHLDTSGVEPRTHAVPLEIHSRPDDVEQRLSVDAIFQNAPDSDQNQFKVPKVVEGS